MTFAKGSNCAPGSTVQGTSQYRWWRISTVTASGDRVREGDREISCFRQARDAGIQRLEKDRPRQQEGVKRRRRDRWSRKDSNIEE
jgi:hypothetical protein